MYRIDMYLTNFILNLLTILLAVEVVTISSQGFSFKTPVFRGNRIYLQWNGTTGLTYAIRVIPEGGSYTDYIDIKTTNFTVENALLFQHYTFFLYQGSVEKHRITYKTPGVVYASVKDDVDMTWPLSRYPGFGGYSIKNVDINNVLIQLDGFSPPALNSKYRFLGDAMNLTNITSIKIPNVEVTDGGYIASLKPQEDLGGAILAVHEKPSKPVIVNTTNDFIIGKYVTLHCSSKQQSSPDYVAFGPLSYTWLVDTVQTLPPRYGVNGTTLTILKVEKSDAQRSISCKASQGSKTSEMSDSLRMNVLYGPSGVTISPQQNPSLEIVEGGQIGPYSCTADCNPPCKFEWKFQQLDKKFTLLNKSNTFMISNVLRNQSGTYRCRASTDLEVSPSYSRDDIKINVLYAPDKPDITINNSNRTVGVKAVRTENSSLALVCTANSNPPASMTWIKGATQQLHSTKSTGNITHVLRNIQCQDSAIYTCQADNSIGKHENTSFELEVQCAPRLYAPKVFQSKYGVELNNSLEINVTVTANPQPTFVWNDSPLSPSNTNVVKKPNSSFIFVFTSNFQITEQKHFGNYTFRVMNDKGGNEYTIAVIARGKPLPPSNFSYKDVQQTSINLTWISGFNGGSVQKFIIQRSTVAGWVLVGNVSDQGQGHEISHLVSGLSPGQRYAFRMYSFNRFGNNSESSLSLSVTTKGFQDPSSSAQGNIAGVAAGVAAFIVVLIISAVIVGVIYVLKKKQNQKGDTVTEDVFYAVVNNKPDNGGHAADNADALYANDDDLSGAVNAQASGGQQRSKNQDGLVYIDVEFKSPSKEAGGKLGKPVIHGDDTRTDYMQVDFTRRGSPDLDATE